MEERKENIEATMVDDTAIDLPLVNISKQDVLGALLVHTANEEPYRDALLKLQTWVVNFAEEQISPLRESGCFTEDELENIKTKNCVISPITLTLYLHWLQMEDFAKLPDSEKEKMLLEKLPDRFKARYKGNAACRNAREVSSDEEQQRESSEESAEAKDNLIHMTFDEFLKQFGETVKAENQGG